MTKPTKTTTMGYDYFCDYTSVNLAFITKDPLDHLYTCTYLIGSNALWEVHSIFSDHELCCPMHLYVHCLQVDRTLYDSLSQSGWSNIQQTFTVPARSGKAWELKAGQTCRIVIANGSQVRCTHFHTNISHHPLKRSFSIPLTNKEERRREESWRGEERERRGELESIILLSWRGEETSWRGEKS